MKLLMITAGVFLLATCVCGKPNQAPAASQKNAQTQGQTAFVNLENYKETSAHSSEADNYPPKWYAPFERPDWWLVGIAFLTGLAIAYQAREMTRATEEMRKNTELQKASLAQWVVTDNWHGGAAQFSDLDGYFMTIGFDIVNPTRFRLTLHAITVGVLGNGSWTIRRPDFLPPDGRYPVSINVPLKDAKRGGFGGTEFSPSDEIINVSVEYEDVLGQGEIQKFAMSCALISELKTDFMPLTTILSKAETKEKQGQS